jgi:hypothetical protein
VEDRLFNERDLKELERNHAGGLSSRQILDLFNARGIKFSEATFRKYIQLGLLPRSKRIGMKGKHRGSQGVYPAGTIRRIVTIKQMMAENYTIEEIQHSFLQFKDALDSLEGELNELFDELEQKLGELEATRRRTLLKDLADARKTGTELVKQLGHLERQVAGQKRGDEPVAAASGGKRAGKKAMGQGPGQGSK